MTWKVWLLIKLTLGIWDQELLETYEIKHLCDKFNFNSKDNDSKHEAMLATIGEAYSLLWQFFPKCVLVAKAGEAFNAHPVFIADQSAEIAREQHKDTIRKVVWPPTDAGQRAQLLHDGLVIAVEGGNGMLVWFEVLDARLCNGDCCHSDEQHHHCIE